MPFNTVLVVSMAHISAELWQLVACLPERVSSDQLLDLVLCFPLQQLGRWALYVWTYFCVAPYDHQYSTSDEDSDDEDGRRRRMYQYRRYSNQNYSSSHSD